MSKVLTATLKKQWYDMTLSGVKKEEYREIKPYWIRRLVRTSWLEQTPEGEWTIDPAEYEDIAFIPFTHTHFTNGYGKHRPSMLIECKGIRIGIGRPEWGAPDYPVFIIEHGGIITTN